MHLSCNINPCLDSAKKWQVKKYKEVCLVDDYVGLRQALSSQGDHQFMVLLVHSMPRATHVVLKQ
jgi:hypothetical protein